MKRRAPSSRAGRPRAAIPRAASSTSCSTRRSWLKSSQRRKQAPATTLAISQSAAEAVVVAAAEAVEAEAAIVAAVAPISLDPAALSAGSWAAYLDADNCDPPSSTIPTRKKPGSPRAFSFRPIHFVHSACPSVSFTILSPPEVSRHISTSLPAGTGLDASDLRIVIVFGR